MTKFSHGDRGGTNGPSQSVCRAVKRMRLTVAPASMSRKGHRNRDHRSGCADVGCKSVRAEHVFFGVGRDLGRVGEATLTLIVIRYGVRSEVVQVMAVDVVDPELWIQARKNGLPERRRVAGFVYSHPG